MEIYERVLLYIEYFLKFSEVNEKFVIEEEEIEFFYKKFLLEFFDLEEGWIVICKFEKDCFIDINVEMLKVFIVRVVFVMFLIWLFIVVIGIVLGVVFFGFIIVIVLVVIFIFLIMGRDIRKKKVIDEEYNKCCMLIRSFVFNEFELICGVFINKLIDRIILDLFFK